MRIGEMRNSANRMPFAMALAGGLLMVLGACDVDRDGEFDSAELERSAERAGAEMADAAEEAGAEMAEAAEEMGQEIEAFFAEWDENADRAFDEEEFERWWSEANPFEDWDADGNDRLSDSELDGVLYVDLETLDADGDDAITRAEMREGLFEILDVDDDGRIDRDEWRRVEV